MHLGRVALLVEDLRGGKFHSSEGGQKSFEKGGIFGVCFLCHKLRIRFSADFGQENPALILIRMACCRG